MKKKLEADLISIAHRVLKLKGKEDVFQLHQEAQKLYEKLAVLRFYEENINVLKNEISEEDLEEKLLDQIPIQPEVLKTEEKVQEVETEGSVEIAEEKTIHEKVAEETTAEEIVEEEQKRIINEEDPEDETMVMEPAQNENEEPFFSPLFELATEEDEKPATKIEQKQILFEDLLGTDYKEPEFIKVNDVPKEVEKATEILFEKVVEKAEEKVIPEIKIETPTDAIIAKNESKVSSLNDTLIKGINIGLNDRIAFVKHLFGGNNEDFNRVISQISTYDSFEEVQQFIVDMVKPDYNNWEGKEEYADRFMNLVEKKFA
jgi:hypothetical protein